MRAQLVKQTSPRVYAASVHCIVYKGPKGILQVLYITCSIVYSHLSNISTFTIGATKSCLYSFQTKRLPSFYHKVVYALNTPASPAHRYVSIGF